MNRLNLKLPEDHAQTSASIIMSDLKATYGKLKNKLKAKAYPHRLKVKSARCNRRANVWLLTMANGNMVQTSQVIITRGDFACHYVAGQTHGCARAASHYTGDASGFISVSVGEKERIQQSADVQFLGPVPKSPKGGRQLTFDSKGGYFLDAETGEPIDGFSKLLLLPNCKALYWP